MGGGRESGGFYFFDSGSVGAVLQTSSSPYQIRSSIPSSSYSLFAVRVWAKFLSMSTK